MNVKEIKKWERQFAREDLKREILKEVESWTREELIQYAYSNLHDELSGLSDNNLLERYNKSVEGRKVG